MRAVTRLGNALLAAALALAPAVALAQQSPPPSTDTVGPSGLQNFSLSGSATRPADQAPAAAPKPQDQPAKAATVPVSRTAPAKVAATPPATRPTAKASPVQRAPQPGRQASPAPPASSPAAKADLSGLGAAPALPPPSAPTASAIATTPPAAFAPAPASPASPVHGGFPLLPWLFAALALGAGGAFLLWRNRLRHAAAAGPLFDLFAPAEPVAEPAAPAPAPAPPAARPTAVAPRPKPATPISSGVVSTGLRPWIDIGFHPQRCILEDQRVTLEFEVELFNSGSSPARAVLVEAIMFNAGPAQDQEIDGFFANPVGAGERIEVIAPLKRMAIRTQLSVPRDRIQAFEVAGRQVFVVLVAFNVLYRLTGGEAQTSVAYLLGRDGQGEKLAPFRVDLGPRIFRGLGARPLPNGVRR